MKYFWITIKHKWYVLLASFKVDLSLWRALIHDLSKFSWAELPHYERQICGDKGDPQGFAVAWLHHYHHNDHHWEHWICESTNSHSNPTRAGNIVNNCLPMPEICVREMITDWLGKEKLITGTWDMAEWLRKSLPKMKLHPKTRCAVYCELERIGYPEHCNCCTGWLGRWKEHPFEGKQIEILADYAHEAWSGWMKYMLGKCLPQWPEGTVIPQGYLDNLTLLMETPYKDMPEKSKESDRVEARKILALLK